LNSHPEVTCDGELLIGGNVPHLRLLRNWRLPAKLYRYVVARAWNSIRILENFISRNDAQVVAFKAMYNHLASKKVKKFLINHPEIKIIHLRRDNLLKQYVSKALLGRKRSRRWEPHSNKKLPVVSTYISPESAIRDMQNTLNQIDYYERFFSNHKKIELVYENMINGKCLNETVTNEICELLSIEKRPLCCDLVKVNPNRLELMIDNYSELVSALKGTHFERYLD
jgi:hypothetical protein